MSCLRLSRNVLPAIVFSSMLCLFDVFLSCLVLHLATGEDAYHARKRHEQANAIVFCQGGTIIPCLFLSMLAVPVLRYPSYLMSALLHFVFHICYQEKYRLFQEDAIMGMKLDFVEKEVSVLYHLPSFLFHLPSSLFPLPSSLFPIPSSLFPLHSSLFPIPSSLVTLASSLFPLASSLLPLPSSLFP